MQVEYFGGNVGYNKTNGGYASCTFLGTVGINVSGGTTQEVYGSSLGRVMSTGPADVTAVYFYGTININITGRCN